MKELFYWLINAVCLSTFWLWFDACKFIHIESIIYKVYCFYLEVTVHVYVKQNLQDPTLEGPPMNA